MQVDWLVDADGLEDGSEVGQGEHGELVGSDGVAVDEGGVSGNYLGAKVILSSLISRGITIVT